MQRRKFSREFKVEAVRLVRERCLELRASVNGVGTLAGLDLDEPGDDLEILGHRVMTVGLKSGRLAFTGQIPAFLG